MEKVRLLMNVLENNWVQDVRGPDGNNGLNAIAHIFKEMDKCEETGKRGLWGALYEEIDEFLKEVKRRVG